MARTRRAGGNPSPDAPRVVFNQLVALDNDDVEAAYGAEGEQEVRTQGSLTTSHGIPMSVRAMEALLSLANRRAPTIY